MTGEKLTYAFHGGVRETGDSDDSLNRYAPPSHPRRRGYSILILCTLTGSQPTTVVSVAKLGTTSLTIADPFRSHPRTQC